MIPQFYAAKGLEPSAGVRYEETGRLRGGGIKVEILNKKNYKKIIPGFRRNLIKRQDMLKTPYMKTATLNCT